MKQSENKLQGKIAFEKYYGDLYSERWQEIKNAFAKESLYAQLRAGENLEKYYLDAVDNCIDGVTEMFLHPALPVEDNQGEWQKRVFEYQILKSGCLLERAKQKGITVVSWSFLK